MSTRADAPVAPVAPVNVSELLAEAAIKKAPGCWAIRIRALSPEAEAFISAIELNPLAYSHTAVTKIINRKFGETVSRTTVAAHFKDSCSCKKIKTPK